MRYIFSVILLVLIFCSQALAFPRFAAKYNQRCGLCHVNPTGCGMRNTYGAEIFSQNDLPAHKTNPDSAAKFNLSDFLSVGLDARTLYVYNENSNMTLYPYIGNGKQSTLFQMEGNLYVNAQVTDKLSVLLNKELYSNFEVYGLGNYLPFNGYFKVGKFQPSFGWRFQDHTSFVRDALIWQPYYYDTGIEAGIYPSNISVNVGFFNGTASQMDDNRGKAVAARFEYRQPIGSSGFGVGGSFWRNDMATNSVDMYGPFFYINLLDGRIVHLGEIDWRKTKNTDITDLATTQSLSFMIQQGIWIEADYDHYDPDINVKSGDVTRYSFHVDYFPIGYLEVQPTYRYYDDKLIDEKYSQFVVQTHFFF